MSASDQTPYTREWLERVRGAQSPAVPAMGSDGLMRAVSEPVRRDWEHPGYDVGERSPIRDPIPRCAADLGLKEYEIAEIVNHVRRIALEYGGSQQLRERLSIYLTPILKGEGRS